jgi:hypothetical protein
MTTVTANPGDNLQSKLDAATGGTLQLGSGTFNVSSSLNIHSNTTILGAANLSTKIVFNLANADSSSYGFVLDANGSNITVQGVDLTSNRGVFGLTQNGPYKSIHILANNIKYGGGQMSQSNNTYITGIFLSVGCNDLQICYNYFHDSFYTRNWELWNCNNSHLDHNLLSNVSDGGHLLESSNTTFAYNYGTHLHRMGQEIQGTSTSATNLVFDHNVFYDWVTPYNDSEGLSVCPNFTTNIVVSNNYFRLNIASGSGWGTMTGGAVGGPNRFGYVVESIAPNLLAENNIGIMAECSADFIGSGEGTTANSNQIWGGSNALWGVFGGDGSPTGTHSSYNLGTGAQANTIVSNLTGAPNPPANTFAGPQFFGGAKPVPVSSSSSAPQIAGLTATVTDNGAVLSWTNAMTNIAIHTYTPSDDCGTVKTTGPLATAQLANLNAGWGYSFNVSGTVNGTTISGTVSATTTGQSPDGTTSTQATLVTVTPPPVTKVISEVVTVTSYTNGVAGKTVIITTYSDGTITTS